MSNYPSFNDREFDLLKKICDSTASLADGSGIPLTIAEANLLYFRLDGTNSALTNTSSTVVTVQDGFSLTSAGSIALTAGGSNKDVTIAPSGTGSTLTSKLGITATSGNTSFNMTAATTADVDLITMRDSGSNRKIELLWNGTTHATVYGMPAGTGGINSQTDFYFSLVDAVVGSFKATTGWQFSPKARTSGSSSYLNYSSPSDTGLTANTECLGINYALGQTRTWADGTVATQREVIFQAPTYAKTTTAATFTTAATVAITNAPQAAAGVTITNPLALWVQAGTTRLDGIVTVGGVTTVGTNGALQLANGAANATSGIGFGNDTSLYRVSTGLLTLTNGSRDIIWNTNLGNLSIKGSAGGYNIGYLFQGSAATAFGGFFCNANTDTFSKFFVGDGAATSWMDFTATAVTPKVPLNVAPAARTSGVASYLTVTPPADTSITAATESIGVNFATATRSWATTGTVTNQREHLFAGKTYASASASQTFTDISTVAITKPIAGTNAIFTRAHSLQVVDLTSAASAITGAVVIATTLGTAATSVGIGGGNVYAGGAITSGGNMTPVGRLMLPMGEASYFSTTGTLITAPGTSDGSTNMTVCNPATTLVNDMEFDNGGGNTGRIRYTGVTTKTFHVAMTFSGTPATNNDIFVFGVAKNGTVQAASKILSTFAGTQGTALHVMVSLATNDYLELYVGNTSATRNITLKSLNVFAMGM